MEGTLTIKGKSQKVTIPATVVKTSKGRLILTGARAIDRTEFGIKFGSSAMADHFIKDEFTLNFSLQGLPQ